MPNLINRSIGAAAGKPIGLFAAATSDGNYMTFESPVGTDYSVPAGTIFKILTVIAAHGANNTGFAKGHHIGYGDNGVANGATSPTAAVYLIGDGATQNSTIILRVRAASTDPILTAIDPIVVPVYAEVPAGKFPFVRYMGTSAVGAGVMILGVEEAV